MGSIPRITLSDSSKSSLFSFGDFKLIMLISIFKASKLKTSSSRPGVMVGFNMNIVRCLYVHVYVIILCIAAPTESLTHSNSDKLSFGSESPLVPAHDSDTNISYGFGY